MPELPDVVVYCEALERLYAERTVERVQLRSPFVVRTFEPELFADLAAFVFARGTGRRTCWR